MVDRSLVGEASGFAGQGDSVGKLEGTMLHVVSAHVGTAVLCEVGVREEKAGG